MTSGGETNSSPMVVAIVLWNNPDRPPTQATANTTSTAAAMIVAVTGSSLAWAYRPRA